ncbi:MAG: rhodanese-like domain-containing protein [Candidatus Krumholzibacteria bacterium]|nr:rhodanese-like domain-containing protein [Candidatus Krumholzibacteria bacterium]
MAFVKNLLGGVIIMVFATLVGVAQNAVRSDPITLFPKISTPAVGTTALPGNASSEMIGEEMLADEGSLDPTSSDVTPAELAAGELSTLRVKAVMDAGAVTIIDARGNGEYAQGHIPGALNIPYENFVEYYKNLDFVPIDAIVIIYCRSVTCDLSDNLAQELRLMGYEKVLLYRGGWQEWSEAGLPTEVDTPSESQ